VARTHDDGHQVRRQLLLQGRRLEDPGLGARSKLHDVHRQRPPHGGFDAVARGCEGDGCAAELAHLHPQGAVFAAFKPNQTPESDTEPGVGDFSWHELPTTDWRAAVTFYRQLFGWEPISSMDMGPEMGTYQMYGLKGKTLGGMFNKPKQMAGPPAWLPYITVPDSKKAAATVKKLGGQVVNGPMEVPGGGWIAQGVDLQGAMFAVHSAKPVAVKKAAGATPVKRAAVKEPVETRAAGGAAGTRPTEAKKRSAGAKKKPAAKKGSAKKRPAAAKKRPTVKKRPAAAKRRPAAKKRRR
jgi:predicted enzyme related to lactoylglutathione lyase